MPISFSEDSPIQVMGILNYTPDSFSDGGRYNSLDNALRHTESMIAQGADIIDIGGESTRPGAAAVSADEEIQRTIPIIQAIKQRFSTPVSIDTSKPEVMQAAIDADVDMINDVRALQEIGAMEVCAQTDIPICLMHMQGMPRTMQENPIYTRIVDEVCSFFEQRITLCKQHEIQPQRLILDPGFGFGKTLKHNLELLGNLEQFKRLNLPLLVGISRKSMIGSLLNNAPTEHRMHGSIAAAVIAAMKGVKILRVHDVKPTVDAIKIVSAIQHGTTI